MDLETAATIGLPIDWVGDRIGPQDVKPRHIGRVLTADVLTYPEDNASYETYRLIGVLEGVTGATFYVNGAEYEHDELQNVRVWRREIRSKR